MKETFKPFIGSYEVIVLYIDNHQILFNATHYLVENNILTLENALDNKSLIVNLNTTTFVSTNKKQIKS